MDKKIKEKWVQALRSGEYKQGTTLLYNKEQNTYCCLGVLSVINGVNPNLRKRRGEEYLSQAAEKEFDLTYDEQQILGRMNDGSGYEVQRNFIQIADYIEKEL
jgi:hypothetical protein